VTLICLHSREGSSRSFARFLPEIAGDRSVYAPDLPGFGESDPAPSFGHADAAKAVSDLANDLRLRQIDLLGVRFGAAVALELAVVRPELVRRLVLIGSPSARSGSLGQAGLPGGEDENRSTRGDAVGQRCVAACARRRDRRTRPVRFGPKAFRRTDRALSRRMMGIATREIEQVHQ